MPRNRNITLKYELFREIPVVGIWYTTVELGQYRYFRSVSVFGIFLGIFQSRYRCRYFKISRYRYFFWTIRPTIVQSLLVPCHALVSKQSAMPFSSARVPTETYN